jgi:hypothetical protein
MDGCPPAIGRWKLQAGHRQSLCLWRIDSPQRIPATARHCLSHIRALHADIPPLHSAPIAADACVPSQISAASITDTAACAECQVTTEEREHHRRSRGPRIATKA